VYALTQGKGENFLKIPSSEVGAGYYWGSLGINALAVSSERKKPLEKVDSKK